MIDGYPLDHPYLKAETSYCVLTAAARFSLPVEGLLGVLLAEGGRVGETSKNTNGSVDIGPMQVNSVWLKPSSPLYRFITYDMLKNDVCTNIHTGAWILASHLKKTGDIWRAIGHYHSPGNSDLAQSYRSRVNARLGTARKFIAHYNQMALKGSADTPANRDFLVSSNGAENTKNTSHENVFLRHTVED